MWFMSDIEAILKELFSGIPQDEKPMIYGDPAYNSGYGIMCAYTRQLGKQLKPSQQRFNTEISSVLLRPVGILDYNWPE
jgi:hypothetical protein